MNPKHHLSFLYVIVLSLVSAGAAAQDAKAELVDMAKTLAGAERFSVSMRMGYDVVQESGRKIEFSEIRDVTVSRPSRMRAQGRQSDGDVRSLIVDGTTITQFHATENVYSRVPQPGDLDAAIRYIVGTLRIRVPLARMLLSTFPDDLERLSTDIVFVERNTLDATPTYHVAGRFNETDFQMWIADDDLPRRIVLTYTSAPGQPQFWAEFSDWNLAPDISEATFAFTPPEGAEEIPTLLLAPRTSTSGESEGAVR